MRLHVGIDVGGTFTDIAINLADADRTLHYKVPSTPAAPDRAIVSGIAAALAEHGLDRRDVVRLSHGTTVATNALIQRRCGKVALVTTDGFADLIEIRRQARPRMYDVHLDHPPPLVPRQLRFEVTERRRADGVVHKKLDEDALRALAPRLRKEAVDCVVVCFLHSYAYPAHEERAVAILRELLPPSVHVIASSAVYPAFREYERFSTAVLNGALMPVLHDYLGRFTESLAGLGISADPKLSQSVGGLMSLAMARDLPIRSALSGPAAGVLGAAYRASAAGFGNVITLDVGGTSTDVSLLQGGAPREVQHRELAGFPLLLPTLDVNAVGAGGGSIAWLDIDGLMKVGPRSAGADPGPACYGLGGTEATVTDANVLLGRLQGEALLGGRMPIRRELAESTIAALARELGLDLHETALGIVRVAGATIVKAIGTISIERGHNPADFSLFAFGGAGPLHATDVAREMDIGTVIVPPHPGILCAEGLLNADLIADYVFSTLMILDDGAAAIIEHGRRDLLAAAMAWFERECVPAAARRLVWNLRLRYRGQNFELSVPFEGGTLDMAACRTLRQGFHAVHERAYGYASPAETVEFVSLQLKAVGLLDKPPLPRLAGGQSGKPTGTRQVMFGLGEWHKTALYRREDLVQGQEIVGPAIIEQLDATTPIFPGDVAAVDAWGNLIIRLT